MSRYYSMALEVHDPKPESIKTIEQAARVLWPFDIDDFTEHGRCLTAMAEGNLCGGKSEEKFALQLAQAIWEANGGFCQVTVEATCLDHIPAETYSFGPDEYRKQKE